MREGDMVKIRNFCWSVRIEDGKLKDKWYRHEKEETWEVLASDCKLPSNPYSTGCSNSRMNNTIICSQKSGVVVFTQEKYLKRVGRKCLYCGQTMKEEEG